MKTSQGREERQALPVSCPNDNQPGHPRRESGGAGVATLVAAAKMMATTTTTLAARPPGSGGTGPPCRGGGANGTVTCDNCCLTLGYTLDHNLVQGEPLVGVEPMGLTLSLYYNPPGQFWE